MSAAIYFLAATGALVWLYAGWRAFQFAREATRRLRWALWGYRKPPRGRAA